MRKFISFFLFVILIFGDASAVSVCADAIQNCKAEEMNETLAASNWDYYDYWAAECDVDSPANGTNTVRFIGVGECVAGVSEYADDGVTAINVERAIADYNKVCVCRLLGPYVSPWIVSPYQWGNESDCMRYCAMRCVNIIQNPGSDEYNAMIYPLSE